MTSTRRPVFWSRFSPIEKSTHGLKLVLSSGATNEGVPKIIDDFCEKLGIDAMGVTSAKAFDYPLGKMKYLIVQGDDWGAESSTFLATSDEILLLGGGGQAKREAIAAETEGKMVTVFQGFKGKRRSADRGGAAERHVRRSALTKYAVYAARIFGS